MSTTIVSQNKNRRILVIDDEERIHADFLNILEPSGTMDDVSDSAAAAVADEEAIVEGAKSFEVQSAFQGQQGLELARAAAERGRPFAAAFVDLHMPPGWNGVETIPKIWRECSDLEVVICIASSDYGWQETIAQLGYSDQFLILKKPFDKPEVRQLAQVLTAKWQFSKQSAMQLEELQKIVQAQERYFERVYQELLAIKTNLQQPRD